MELFPISWGEFGVAAAGATAALAGLLVVAISVNVKEILASKTLVHGTRATIASLVLAIAVSLFLIVSNQPVWALGLEALVLAAPAIVIQVLSIATQSSARREGVTGQILAVIVTLAALQYLPFVVGGVLLVCGFAAGAWVIAVGIIVVVISSMVNAWVLLLEVRS